MVTFAQINDHINATLPAYPGAVHVRDNLPKTVKAYFEELQRFSAPAVVVGFRMARENSPSFFPPAPLIAKFAKIEHDRLTKEEQTRLRFGEDREVRESPGTMTTAQIMAEAQKILESAPEPFVHPIWKTHDPRRYGRRWQRGDPLPDDMSQADCRRAGVLGTKTKT